MKKLIVILWIVTACGGREEPALTVTCTPAVDVMVSIPGPKSTAKAAPATVSRQRVVQVYWDVSRSMRDFRPALTPVVATLDSSILLKARAEAVNHYEVAESIRPLASAQAALTPRANRTALHLAAEQIGTALANGTAQAALVISDLELDTPPSTRNGATVCGGVPLPLTPVAGPLFGRCYEKAIGSVSQARTQRNLLAHVFRMETNERELFILLLATDRAFGQQISNEIAEQLEFARHVIFDSGSVAAANVKGCRLDAPAEDVMQKAAAHCTMKCFEPDTDIQAECELRRAASDAWIAPIGHGVDGAAYELLKKKPGDGGEQALVRFGIPCNTPPGRFDASVSFSWHKRTPWSQGSKDTFARKASVRDLFDSLTDAIVRTVAPRRLRIGIALGQ
ncbi:MAG TPA: hypothetical protein VEK11_26165 [Thermoanaerobaculia bacterium]|nr:hypothetical protein [Thermoanaerobaculia bacterium]